MKIALFFVAMVLSLTSYSADAKTQLFRFESGRGNCPKVLRVDGYASSISVNGRSLQDLLGISPGLFGERSSNAPFQDNGLTMESTEHIKSDPCSYHGLQCEMLIFEKITTIGWNEGRNRFYYKVVDRERQWNSLPSFGESPKKNTTKFACYYRAS